MSLESSFVIAISAFSVFVDSQLPKFGLPKMGLPKVGIPKLGMPEITRVRAEELYDCPDNEGLPIRFSDVVLSYLGPGKVKVDGIIDIKEPMEKPVTPEITRVRAEELYDCPDNEGLPIRFSDVVLSYLGPGKVKVDGIIDIKEPMEKPVTLETKMYKCVSKSEPDTCEYYHTFRSPEVCALLGVSGRFWNTFTNGTDLPKECPFPEGTYNVSNALVDMSDMNAIPVFESYWKFQNSAFHKNKKLMCVICEFSVSPAYRGRG